MDMLSMIESGAVRVPISFKDANGVEQFYTLKDAHGDVKVPMLSGSKFKQLQDKGIQSTNAEFSDVLDSLYENEDHFDFSNDPVEAWILRKEEVKLADTRLVNRVYNAFLQAGNVQVGDIWNALTIKQPKMEGTELLPNGRNTMVDLTGETEKHPLSVSFTEDSVRNPVIWRTVKFNGRGTSLPAERLAIATAAKLVLDDRGKDITKESGLYKGYAEGDGTDAVTTGAVGGGLWSADVTNAVNAVLGTIQLFDSYGKEGPFTLMLSSDLSFYLDKDMATLSPTRTLRERLLAIPSITSIEKNRNLDGGEFTLSSNDPSDWNIQSSGGVELLEIVPTFTSVFQGQSLVAYTVGTVMNFPNSNGDYNVILVTGNL